jgi:hypothetical protein
MSHQSLETRWRWIWGSSAWYAHHDEATEGVAWSRLMQQSDVMYAVSASFLARAEEWFTGIASHELASVFEPSVPSSDLFLGFPGHPDEDAHGNGSGSGSHERI